MAFTSIRISGPKRANLSINLPAYLKMGPQNVDRLKSAILNPIDVAGRTSAVLLDSPFFVKGEAFNMLRIKGIDPKIGDDGAVLPHTGGGRDPYPTGVHDSGVIFLDKAPYTPEGGMLFSRAKNEVRAAEMLGTEFTDYPIGYGEFEDLRFAGDILGFCVYAVRGYDFRLLEDFIYPSVSCGVQVEKDPATIGVIKGFGRVLSEVHYKGVAHRYPHLENVGIANLGPTPKVLIKDLDTARFFSEMTQEQITAYMMLDIIKALAYFHRIRCMDGKKNGQPVFYDLFSLAPYFVEGYFGQMLPITKEDYADMSYPLREIRNKLNFNRGFSFDMLRWYDEHENMFLRDILLRLERKTHQISSGLAIKPATAEAAATATLER